MSALSIRWCGGKAKTMNVIFLTLARITDIEQRGIYQDLLRKFRDKGHQVYIVSPIERRFGLNTDLQEINGVKVLNVKTLNVQKTNVFEKGLGTLLLEWQYKTAIKKYLNDIKFNLILYSTPPITLVSAVNYLKAKNPHAVSYLLLKDIFPQNAVDIGMFGKRSAFYWFFRKKEIALYKSSNFIGCMSPANVEFVLTNNNFIGKDRVEVAPNSIELGTARLDDGQKNAERFYIRKKYALPTNIPIFIYGGNLGKPQGIDFLIRCLDANKNRRDCFFVIVGNGTEYHKLASWFNKNKGGCVKLIPQLPKDDYDILVRSCDIGLIFLDHRFTIPNYPSRLLSYLENKMPVLCATDINTDIGKIAEDNGYGYWCESVRPEVFTALVDKMLGSDRLQMGINGYHFLQNNYLVEHTYNTIVKHF